MRAYPLQQDPDVCLAHSGEAGDRYPMLESAVDGRQSHSFRRPAMLTILTSFLRVVASGGSSR